MAFLLRPGPAVAWRAVSRVVTAAAGRRPGRVLIGAALLGVGLRLYGRYRRGQRRQRWNQAGKDVVVLHQIERGTNVPNLSSFALKLETFLRMAGISYVVDTEEPKGPKGKFPWITFNGLELSDTELIIDHLSKHFNKPIKEEGLTPSDHAVGRSTQIMLDEHTMLAVEFKRYILDEFSYVATCHPAKMRRALWLMKGLFLSKMKEHFYVNGIGRFSEQETLFFLRRELRALQDVLGGKQFLLGSTPTTYDADVFAVLTQVIYVCAPQVESYVRDNHDVLVRYHDRMKNKYWPDWEQCLAQ